MPHPRVFAVAMRVARAAILRGVTRASRRSDSLLVPPPFGQAGRSPDPAPAQRGDAMRDPERIAELQRLAYGAGATDAERRSAAEELEAIRDGRPAAARTGATERRDDGQPVDPPAAETSVGGNDGAPVSATEASRAPARPPLRWVAIAAAAALIIGYVAGAVDAEAARGTAPAPTATSAPQPGEMPLELPPGAVMDVAETRVVEIFERPATVADLAVDLTMFSFTEMDPSSPRLLATRSDGIRVWVARTVDGDVCLVIRVDEFAGSGGCTMDRLFPVTDGIGVESYDQGAGHHSAYLDQWGELRIRVEGVSGGPRS
jgi:hypothetical protein